MVTKAEHRIATEGASSRASGVPMPVAARSWGGEAQMIAGQIDQAMGLPGR